MLSLNQNEMAIKSGLTQRDVSRIESGKAKFIPNHFMHFLHKTGVNMNYLYGDKDALPFSHTNTHLNDKYGNEKNTFVEGEETNTEKDVGKNYHFNSDRLIELIDKLEGDRETKEKLKNELIRLLMEVSESKDKIIHLMKEFSEMADNLNKKFKGRLNN